MTKANTKAYDEQANEKYEEKRLNKRVSFNATTEKQLYDHAANVLPSFSEWVKNKLQEDLQKEVK